MRADPGIFDNHPSYRVCQFSRLAIVLRRSGRSIFTRIPAIDLSAAQDARYALDFDLDDEEAELADRRAAGGDHGASLGRSEQGRAGASVAPGPGSGSGPGGAQQAGASSKSSQQPFLLASDDDEDEDFLDRSPRTRSPS